MSLPRIIKKYPNRRLYDTEISRYITLADIRQLVMDGIDFRVMEKQTQADISATILLQVISEHEAAGSPLLSREFLSAIIRNQSGPLHTVAREFLDQSMELYATQTRELREQLGSSGQAIDNRVAHVDRSLSQMKSLQKEVLTRIVTSNTGGNN